MTQRKILLKDDAGNPLSSLTIPFRAGGVLSLPMGMEVDAYEEQEILFPIGRTIRLVSEPPTFSLIGKLNGKRVFATTLPEGKAAFAKWKLLCALEERQNSLEKVPTSPLEKEEKRSPFIEPQEQDQAPIPCPTPEEQEDALPTQEGVEVPQEQTGNESLTRAEALLQSGEPFTLFAELMPGSRWAKIKEEEYEYLVGITGDTPPRVLYGIAGMLDYPPDEDRLWTFFPTGEDGEEGYYLTEAEKDSAPPQGES